MHNFQRLFIFVTILLLFTQTYAHVHGSSDPHCAHNKFNHEPELLEVDEILPFKDGRLLQTVTYPQIRIKADYSLLVNGTAEFINYVKINLMPPVIDYFQAALKVKAPLSSNLKLSTTTKVICGGPVPAALYTGVATDFYLIVSSTEDVENWVASAGSCYLSGVTKRPLIANMQFNMLYTTAAGDDVLAHEKNMYLTMHEMMHALGFAGSSFKNFIDANGNTLTGHIKNVSLNGVIRTVLAVEPLVTRLRTHFGCSTLLGAFLEDEGGAGTAGSHFERRHFLYDHMTSGVIHGRRISEFSLAVLDGSGWYAANYSYAEPYFYGQGQGCNFLYQQCTETKQPPFHEFCDGSSRSCTATGRSGGICTSDSRSDDCRYVFPMIDYDCENDAASENARFPDQEVFGRAAGSKCFEGNLTKLTKSTYTSFCFKFNCVGTGLTTSLEVLIGTTKVICTAEGTKKVTGFNGLLNCPDPLEYCKTVGKKYCPRNCMGRGTCNASTGVCTCKTGFAGVDCALYS